MKERLYHYQGWVDRVVDGDTVYLTLDVGFKMRRHRASYRLLGIDAPEVRGEERPEGLKAKEYLQTLLPLGKSVVVRTRKHGKYGRYLADLWLEDHQRWVTDLLVENGYAEVS